MNKIAKMSMALMMAVGFVNAAPYEIDKAHSNVLFKVTHLSISKVRGNFSDFDVIIDYDKSTNELRSLDANIKVKSISTDNEKRDEHLRSADFFDIAKFENITFKMTKYVKKDTKEGKVYGDLTIKGITKPVILDFELGGFSKTDNGEKIGFNLNGDIKRKLFDVGADTSDMVISDEVDFDVDIEAISK